VPSFSPLHAWKVRARSRAGRPLLRWSMQTPVITRAAPRYRKACCERVSMWDSGRKEDERCACQGGLGVGPVSVSACVQILFKETDVDDVAASMEGTVFRWILFFLGAGARRGGASAENLRRFCESSSLSAVSSGGRGTGALGRLRDRASMANRSSSVISWHVPIAINCERRGGAATFCHLIDALFTWQLKDEGQ
jgi:hypothetical protein